MHGWTLQSRKRSTRHKEQLGPDPLLGRHGQHQTGSMSDFLAAQLVGLVQEISNEDFEDFKSIG